MGAKADSYARSNSTNQRREWESPRPISAFEPWKYEENKNFSSQRRWHGWSMYWIYGIFSIVKGVFSIVNQWKFDVSSNELTWGEENRSDAIIIASYLWLRGAMVPQTRSIREKSPGKHMMKVDYYQTYASNPIDDTSFMTHKLWVINVWTER